MSYKTPRAFEQAINTHARRAASQNGLKTGDLVTGYYFHRLVARVFHADPHGWLLKGGQALLVRYAAQARLSRDIDLQRLGAEDPEAALETLCAAAATDLGDYLCYEPTKRQMLAELTGGAKQTFDVLIGVRRVASVSIDIVTGQTPTQNPVETALEPLMELEWPQDWPTVRLYPLADHIADKVCAMYTRFQGRASSRIRDLPDLLLICQKDEVEGPAARAALDSERERRRSLGHDLDLPDRFVLPDSSWEKLFPKAAANISGLKGCATLDEARPLADAFLTPLLAGPLEAVWMPSDRAWR
ncbi:nucleotidyl transferase AbiEii/AbiGii toxin family protein [Nocardiopsis halophila]|uniref:nucleotidyl transferase AbiEii/AbiGii toxin family protein n=1 Tax=Nocardiopsis halophila TaxID=141692 RepID=UPI000345282D|nr:nucleotidyl transferase AbiEii/AbiGii toxin family protein [Nocardiopsis halophila]